MAFIENYSKYSIFKKDHLSPLNFQSHVSLCKVEYFFRPCFFSEAKKAKERFKVVVVGGGSDR